MFFMFSSCTIQSQYVISCQTPHAIRKQRLSKPRLTCSKNGLWHGICKSPGSMWHRRSLSPWRLDLRSLLPGEIWFLILVRQGSVLVCFACPRTCWGDGPLWSDWATPLVSDSGVLTYSCSATLLVSAAADAVSASSIRSP
jgi:hypothetical protein